MENYKKVSWHSSSSYTEIKLKFINMLHILHTYNRDLKS
jgi:hypothetical protein